MKQEKFEKAEILQKKIREIEHKLNQIKKTGTIQFCSREGAIILTLDCITYSKTNPTDIEFHQELINDLIIYYDQKKDELNMLFEKL